FVNVLPFRRGRKPPHPLHYKGQALSNTAQDLDAVLVCAELFFERARSSVGQFGNILIIFHDAGPPVPKKTTLTLYDANLNSQLPSPKPGGGRGILTAIKIVTERFRGTCSYDEGKWSLDIPGEIPPPKR